MTQPRYLIQAAQQFLRGVALLALKVHFFESLHTDQQGSELSQYFSP